MPEEQPSYELTATLHEPNGTPLGEWSYHYPTEQIPDEQSAREEMRQVWHWYNVTLSCECRWGPVLIRQIDYPEVTPDAA